METETMEALCATLKVSLAANPAPRCAPCIERSGCSSQTLRVLCSEQPVCMGTNSTTDGTREEHPCSFFGWVMCIATNVEVLAAPRRSATHITPAATTNLWWLHAASALPVLAAGVMCSGCMCCIGG